MKIDKNEQINKIIYSPLLDINPGWLFESKTLSNLALFGDWSTNAELNQWFSLEKKLNLIDESAFSQPVLGIVLLPPSNLVTILNCIGSVLHAHNLASVILKSQKTQVLNLIDKDIFDFSLNQGPYLLSQWPHHWILSLPENLDEDYFLGYGIRFISTFFKQQNIIPSELLLYKLPPSSKKYFNEASLVHFDEEDIACHLINKIIKRVLPECLHLLK